MNKELQIIENSKKGYNFENLSPDITLCYSDGSCNWKNKFGGYGVFILDKEGEHDIYFGEKETTIGRMELLGVILTLQCLNPGEKSVLYCDSEYAINCINKNWLKIWKEFKYVGRKNADLLKIYFEEYNRINIKNNLRLKHIHGHVGYKGNERADQLAKKGYYEMKKYYEDLVEK